MLECTGFRGCLPRHRFSEAPAPRARMPSSAGCRLGGYGSAARASPGAQRMGAFFLKQVLLWPHAPAVAGMTPPAEALRCEDGGARRGLQPGCVPRAVQGHRPGGGGVMACLLAGLGGPAHLLLGHRMQAPAPPGSGWPPPLPAVSPASPGPPAPPPRVRPGLWCRVWGGRTMVHPPASAPADAWVGRPGPWAVRAAGRAQPAHPTQGFQQGAEALTPTRPWLGAPWGACKGLAPVSLNLLPGSSGVSRAGRTAVGGGPGGRSPPAAPWP